MSAQTIPIENINSFFFIIANPSNYINPLFTPDFALRTKSSIAATPKKWWIVAIAVGALAIVGIGGFGILGLLKSHGLISLPQFLSSAIGTIGNTSHFWSLWAMAAGGLALGSLVIVYSSLKLKETIHDRRKLLQFVSEDKQLYESGIKALQDCFSKDNLKELAIPDSLYIAVPSKGEFASACFENEDENSAKYFFIINNNGQLQSTKRLNKQQYTLMEKYFTKCHTGYRQSQNHKQLGFSLVHSQLEK